MHRSETTQETRERLRRAARLHPVHWLILGSSLALTFAFFTVTHRATQERISTRFEAERGHIVELIRDRMSKYEYALWSGVSYVTAVGVDLSFAEWRRYAESLAIEQKYPGIRGIGVIHSVPRSELGPYLAAQRATRPDYGVHPNHSAETLLPISYIVPVEGNEEAVGLDMAHEQNRHRAALAAARTGDAQITGPIVLVQDSAQTPGFLFSAPFFDGPHQTEPERQETFSGLVYAAFVVKRLIDGVLAQESRSVLLRLRDGEQVMYDELDPANPEFDASPLRERSEVISMYGRDWTIEMASSTRFREGAALRQPVAVLLAGLAIDGLLLWFFLVLSRANGAALRLADSVTAELAVANEELTQFNYRTSHDLVAPLRTLQGYLGLAEDDVEEGDLEGAVTWFPAIGKQAEHLANLVGSLLDLSRSGRESGPPEPVDLCALMANIPAGLATLLEETGVSIRAQVALDPPLRSDASRVEQILTNLVANGARYSDPNEPERWVEVTAERSGGDVVIEVTDNGIGVPEEHRDAIFQMFYRGAPSASLGSGLGLYLVVKHLDRMGGTIEVVPRPNGTTFRVVLPEPRP